MSLSIWRYAHLALAIVSSLFLLILSATGIILAIDAINEKTPAYRVENLNNLNLAQTLPNLRQIYPEIIEINIDHNQFVSIDAINNEGNTVKGYIDPNSGQLLGELKPKNQFIQWTTALHRSLFLKETGRIIVAIVSFILFLISISGIVLIAKRQQGFKNFFNKINKDFFAQYFHVVSGRLSLIPVVILALTGTYLFLAKLDFFKKPDQEIKHKKIEHSEEQIDLAKFPIFQQSKLTDLEKIEFPFMEDDPEEFFILKFKDKTIAVNQINGQIVSETRYSSTVKLEKLSLDLHTGRTNIIWAVILGFASLNIIFFIYSGFVITFKRTKTKLKNKVKADEAEIVILVGSENGSTLFFANQIHKQFLADGKNSFIASMNQFQNYPKANKMLIFTSTYGLGTAPTNALKFEELIKNNPQNQQIDFSVIGFGSKSYADYNAYALHVDDLMENQIWGNRLLPVHLVNDKSSSDFIKWVHHWTEKSQIALASAPTLYQEKIVGLKKLQVVDKSEIPDDHKTFTVLLKPKSKIKFQSGDLLTIYPANDARERFYSIAKNNGMIQLEVKLHENGLGSSFLYELQKNQIIQARVNENTDFHLPTKAPAVIMIANGTGIAPFLGMILENKNQKPIHLYTGFRHNNTLTKQYLNFAKEQIEKKHLNQFQIAFSRELQSQYVMDLIKKDTIFFADHLKKGGIIMICGSLNMQKDVEKVIEELAIIYNKQDIAYYKENKQILTDCY